MSTPGPPPAGAIFCAYSTLGAALSFGLGRTPGTLPEQIVKELALPASAISAFLVGYSLLDVLAVGTVKAKLGSLTKKTDDPEPEEVQLAMRAQANQVEQMTGFITSTLLFSSFVNGRVGGVLAAVWAVLRLAYSSTYRASAGVPMMQKGLTKFTIPCYFIINSMSCATIVHMARFSFGS